MNDQTESLAERLLEIGDYERAYCWEMHAAPDVRLYDHHPDASCCEHASAYWATGAAAAELRRLEAENRRLRERLGLGVDNPCPVCELEVIRNVCGCPSGHPPLLDDPSTEEAPQ